MIRQLTRTAAAAAIGALLLVSCAQEAPVEDAAAAAQLPEDTVSGTASREAVSAEQFSADLAPDFLVAGLDTDEATPLLRDWLARAEGEGNRATNLSTRYEMDGRTVLIATIEGMADDSVDSQQIYAEFTPIGPLSNSLDFAGARIRCARGNNTTDWQTELCP